MCDELIAVDDDFWNHPSLLQYAAPSNNTTNSNQNTNNTNLRKRKFNQIDHQNPNDIHSNKKQRSSLNTQNNTINNYYNAQNHSNQTNSVNNNQYASNYNKTPPKNTNSVHRKEELAPECSHKLPMIKRTTRKQGANFGRSFWCCSQSQQNQCKSFLWDNQWQRNLKNMKNTSKYTSLMNHKCTLSTELICIEPIALVEVSIHPFDQDFVDCVKLCSNAQWHQDKRKWVIPLKEHSPLITNLRNKCRKKQYTFTMDVIPFDMIKNVLKWKKINNKTVIKEETEEEEDCVLQLPLSLRTAMYDFQKDGVRFAVSKDGRCLIADEMGLGKSIQAIGIAYYYRNDWPLLVVVPSSLTLTWKIEILKWLKGIIYEDDIKIIKNSKESMVSYDSKKNCYVAAAAITIISYGLTVRKHAEIMDNNNLFGMIICDESHALKNYKTQRCKVVIPLIKRNIKRAILLSGTPTNNRPSELWTQIDALRPNEFMSFKKYSIRYCEGQTGKFGWSAIGAIHLKELHAMIKHRVMIRRCKKEVLTELPDKLRTVISIECDKGLEKKIAKKMEKDSNIMDSMESLNISEEDKSVLFDKKNKNMLLLYALSGKAKITKICEYILHLFENGEKFLVFAHHLDVLDAIEECVKMKCKTSFIRIDGSTKPEKRQILVSSFQNNDSIRIAVLSITAAGTGLTLTAATSVVFAELYWGPTALLQCEDRAHRISQTKIVNIIYLLGKGSLDDKMWPMISKKMEVISKTLSGKQLKMEVESYKNQFIERFSPNKNNKNNKQKRITTMFGAKNK